MPAQPRTGRSSTLQSISSRSAVWRGLGSAAVLAAAAIWAYGRTFSAPFLFDDSGTIATNQSIRHWRTALFPPTWTTAGGRPVLNLSLAINYAISGPAVWSYHLLNLAIHICAGLVLFAILRRTLGPWAGPAGPVAFFAAFLWILHPLQTESVTYVAQRAESLMGLFYLLTLYFFIRYAERGPSFAEAQDAESGQKYWAGLSVLACLFGMATKEVMVSAPLIVLLHDRTFLSGSFGLAWKRHWRVFAGLGGSWLILPVLVSSTAGRGGSAGFEGGVSWWGYLLTQPPAIARYLSLSVWPHPLVFYYGAQWVTDVWAIVPAAVGVAGLLAVTAWALLCPALGARSFGFAGSWFLAILAPTSLIPINRQTAAEHRMYLALIPVVVMAVVGIYRWLGRAALPASLALAAALSVITVRRNHDYRSGLVLWADTVAKCPANPYAHDNLACELEELPGRTREAIAQCVEALRLKPDDSEAHNNLGNALKSDHRTREAISEYEQALRLRPGFAEADNNLGCVLEKTPGRLKDAIALYEAALRLKPDYAEAHYNLGIVLGGQGRTREAIEQYGEALRLRPDYVEAHNNLGNELKADGRDMEAIAQYEAALRLMPAYAAPHFNLAIALLDIPGRTDEAVAHLETFLHLQPENETARQILARIRPSQP